MPGGYIFYGALSRLATDCGYNRSNLTWSNAISLDACDILTRPLAAYLLAYLLMEMQLRVIRNRIRWHRMMKESGMVKAGWWLGAVAGLLVSGATLAEGFRWSGVAEETIGRLETAVAAYRAGKADDAREAVIAA